MRSKKGDVIARAAIKEIQDHGLDQLFEKISLVFPRNPRALARRLDIEVVPFDFSRPGAEILYFCDKTWYLGYRNKDSFVAQNFAITHGIIHWTIHRNKQGFNGYQMKWQFEVGANAAAAVLMIPDDELEQFIYLNDFHNMHSINDVTESELSLRLTAEHFGVSIYVLGWRLVEHKVIKKETKEIIKAYLNTLYSTWSGRPA